MLRRKVVKGGLGAGGREEEEEEEEEEEILSLLPVFTQRPVFNSCTPHGAHDASGTRAVFFL
jgi:hypothetical protein